MNLIIRADSTSQMGAGHVMRCLALAQAWQERGGRAVFLSHCESKPLRQRIKSEGCDLIPMENPHPHPDDLENTLDILPSICNPHSTFSNWLVVDGYHFDSEYQLRIREAGYRLLVIDDMAHLSHYYADILVNQNNHAPDLYYQCNPDATLLLGTRYVLLRGEFLKYRDFKRQIQGQAKKILVTLGGADPDNVSLKVVEAVKLLNDANLEVIVVVGPSNPHISFLRTAMLHVPFSMRLFQNVSNMAELMVWADLCISAGGSTSWELAFMGLPSLILVLADNQQRVAVELDAGGVAIDLGYSATQTAEEIFRALNDLASASDSRNSMNQRGPKLVDGKGAIRVVQEMEVYGVLLRLAQEGDSRLIWEWANDPNARAASFSPEPIPWEQHVEWFTAQILDPRTVFYIATDSKGFPLGQIRYHVAGREAILSVSVAPELRGKGLGSIMIQVASQKVFASQNIEMIKAYVKPTNMVSVGVFLKAGFTENGTVDMEDQKASCFTLQRDIR